VNQLSRSTTNATDSYAKVTKKVGDSEKDVPPPAPESKSFVGSRRIERVLLRVETIEALKLYCYQDYAGFMSMIHSRKSIITTDILNNLNRGPIFAGGMVGIALAVVVQKSLQEFIAQTTLICARDTIYHYLANRNLTLNKEIGPPT
jgi:hypothetical protein